MTVLRSRILSKIQSNQFLIYIDMYPVRPQSRKCFDMYCRVVYVRLNDTSFLFKIRAEMQTEVSRAAFEAELSLGASAEFENLHRLTKD